MFYVIQIGSALIRATASQLPKFLSRFKGAKHIKKPSQAQLDKSRRYDKNLTEFNKVDKKVLNKADSKKPSFMEKLTGKGRTAKQDKLKNVDRGEDARTIFNTRKADLVVGTPILAGTAAVAYSSGKGKKVEKKNTDGPKGKPKSVPKGLRESIAKDKKKDKPTPKKKPVAKKIVEEKKKKQLMMKEKYTGKDSNVKFNSRGGMLKKGKK